MTKHDHHDPDQDIRHLQTLASLHEAVVATMAEGIVVQTASGEIRLANPAALAILGLTLDQITGKTSLDPSWQALREDGSAFPGEDHPAMVTLRTGQALDGVVMGVSRPDGTRKWIRINSRPLFSGSDSKPKEVVVTFADITSERAALAALAAKRARLDMALDIGAIGVLEKDNTAGEIRYFGNLETLQRLGMLERFDGTPFLDRVCEDMRGDIAQKWMDHLAGGPRLRTEVQIAAINGTLRWVLIAAEKLVDGYGKHCGALVAIKDIEDRKRAEFALIESMHKLERAARAKDEFLANIGHEIRTPLNGVIGMASALGLTNLSPEQQEMVSLITSSGEVLDRLLNDLLDMSKLDAGKVQLEPAPFDLCAAVTEASQLFEIRADEKGLRFSLDLAPEAYGVWMGDKVRIKQIVANLVSNAIKYTDKGQVQVRLSATGNSREQALDWITLAVEDTGVGISETAQQRIFDRFEQAGATPFATQGGTGLGLAICKSMVALMGGEMALSSEVGLGSTFSVRLPLNRVATAASPSDTADADAKRLMRVLLVDDHPTNRRVVEAMLRAFDCTVTSAANGAEAMAVYETNAFDLVLMDMQMPVMDGIAATRAIRTLERDKAARRTPLAMLTAYGSDQHRRDSQDAGADFHIVKPVTPVTLLAGLEKAMRAARAADAA